jgi:hypothetical protein
MLWVVRILNILNPVKLQQKMLVFLFVTLKKRGSISELKIDVLTRMRNVGMITDKQAVRLVQTSFRKESR